MLSESFENIIVLSDEFYNEVMAHPIPADIEAVKAFGSAPAVLDLLMWLTYRCFTAKAEERIPVIRGFRPTPPRRSWDQSNTPDRGDFAPCPNNGCAKFVQSGRSVRRRSAPMATICDSVRRKRFCRRWLNAPRDFTCAAIDALDDGSLVVAGARDIVRITALGGQWQPSHASRTDVIPTQPSTSSFEISNARSP